MRASFFSCQTAFHPHGAGGEGNFKQEIISAENAPDAARVVRQLWEFDFAEDERDWKQFYKNRDFFAKRLDKELAGMMMVARTQPSARQMLEVRHELVSALLSV